MTRYIVGDSEPQMTRDGRKNIDDLWHLFKSGQESGAVGYHPSRALALGMSLVLAPGLCITPMIGCHDNQPIF